MMNERLISLFINIQANNFHGRQNIDYNRGLV